MKRAVFTAATLLLLACGGGEPAVDVIEPETFIATWVELRGVAARSRLGVLSPSERTRVLQEHGVSEDELLAFVDAYGDDPRFMLEVWAEVESRMRPEPRLDTTSAPTG